MAEYLPEQLRRYCASDYYPLHMPGHKRRLCLLGQPYGIDITEIEGFDNLHHAQGVLLEAQRRAAALYGAEETYYLVNGSTCGILAAVSACAPRGGRILMARNSHRASYHAALLNGLRATYVYPSRDSARGISGSISPEKVRDALAQHTDICAVLITSPTYDGVVSDVRAIAKEAHRAGVLLIVDEAHGAHFGLHPYFPESALSCGADLVINSLHKTLPSLTQTALLHVQGSLADREKLRRYLGIYQTSSPSYVLMAGMDACIGLLQQRGAELFETFAQRLETMRSALRRMRALHLVDGREEELAAWDFDRSKVLISLERSSLEGPQLGRLLRDTYHLEPEMEAMRCVTALMTVADAQEGFDRLEEALLAIDAGEREERPSRRPDPGEDGIPKEEVMSMQEAGEAETEAVPLADSAGRICAEFVYLYPPGIPMIVPGERIPDGFARRIGEYRAAGLSLQGMADFRGETICTVKEKK